MQQRGTMKQKRREWRAWVQLLRQLLWLQRRRRLNW